MSDKCCVGMEDDTARNRTIDRLILSVLSGIDWGSQQVKSTCPSRERWSWKNVWNLMNKSETKKEELEKQEEDKVVYHSDSQLKEKNIGLHIEHNELSGRGYQYCEIKMQDPCAPCCCAVEECVKPPPCTDIARVDRTPRCECTKRKEIKTDHKCCDDCGVVRKTPHNNI